MMNVRLQGKICAKRALRQGETPLPSLFSILKAPEMDRLAKHFFWNGGSRHQYSRLVNWGKTSLSLHYGGLDLGLFNREIAPCLYGYGDLRRKKVHCRSEWGRRQLILEVK